MSIMRINIHSLSIYMFRLILHYTALLNPESKCLHGDPVKSHFLGFLTNWRFLWIQKKLCCPEFPPGLMLQIRASRLVYTTRWLHLIELRHQFYSHNGSIKRCTGPVDQNANPKRQHKWLPSY